MIPFASFAIAVFTIIVYYIGFQEVGFALMGITAIFALAGMIFGDKDHPISGRVSSVLAAALAFAPVLGPMVKEFRLDQLAAQRAAETAPYYRQMDEIAAELEPEIFAYRERTGIYPDMQGEEVQPRVAPDGQLQTPPPAPELAVPQDPFLKSGQDLRWIAVRDRGVLLVSVGQDGVAELPLPGIMMDPPPAHPMTGFAILGLDPRTRIYDPASGGLGLGDVVRWIGESDMKEAFADLYKAWDLAEDRSPYRPTEKKRPSDVDDNPQSARDSRAAEKLLRENEYLAAAALASRAINERHVYEAQWKAEDYRADMIKGIALYNLAAFREAADALIDYTVTNPNDAVAHYYLAAALYRGGNPAAAETHLSAASVIDPQNSISSAAYSALQSLESNREPAFPTPGYLSRQDTDTEQTKRRLQQLKNSIQ